MEINQVMLLLQISNQLKENFEIFEKAYNEQDKEKFDSSKKLILELQKKINILARGK